MRLVLGEEFALDLEAALKAQFALCTQTQDLREAYLRRRLMPAWTKLRASLRAQPQTFNYRDPLTFAPASKQLNEQTLAALVRMFAYTSETAALLPLSIAPGLKGDYAPLAGQTGNCCAGTCLSWSTTAYNCDPCCAPKMPGSLLTPRPEDADTVLGAVLIDALKAQCQIWPHGTRPADFHNPLKSDTPVLVLEGELDPVTPPRYGEQVLKNLGNARLLVAKGQAHNVIGRGCIPKLVEEFVDKLQPKNLDAKCLDALAPMPALIDFNGAAP